MYIFVSAEGILTLFRQFMHLLIMKKRILFFFFDKPVIVLDSW